MSTTTLSQSTLILHVCNYIALSKDSLLGDLVSYTEDPVRYTRRIRILCQLAVYESQIIEKISRFETSDLLDLDFALESIKQEVDQVSNIYA